MHSLSIRNITKYLRFACATLLVLALPVFVSSVAHAQTTVFTYQGRLNDGGSAANGVFDMQFKLYDTADPSASAQIGSTITNSNVAVTNGIFTVRLDFGASALPGANRFLEVGVRRISSDPYTVLAPRQQVTSAPYAIRSANAVVADQLSTACVGCVQDAQISSVAASKLTGTLPASSIPAGNSNYIQNTTSQQLSSNFNISGNGTAGTLNAATQYNIGGNRVLSIPGTNNTFVGVSAGQSNTTGSENTFFGNLAGFSNTTGVSNSFFGLGAGRSNAIGSNNAFFGRDTGFSNTMGTANAFFGRSAGIFNTTGSNNAFFGRAAGQANTTGSNNAFFGDTAGLNNTASGNSFFGSGAGQTNTTGSANTFVGLVAGQSNNTGFANAFFGNNAGNSNTSGFRNAFFGEQAGRLNVTGRDNSFFGNFAGRNNAAGSENSFLGGGAGGLNTTGTDNTFVGFYAGQSNTSENNNTFIGAGANGAPGITNATAIGAGAQVTSSNTMVLGTGAVTVQVPGNLNITTLSANAVNAATQYNIGGNRVFGIPGTSNTFAGVSAGQDNTDGVSNAFFGTQAGKRNRGGFSNAFFGSQAGQANTTGAGNAFFGDSAGIGNNGSSNAFFGNVAGFKNTNGGGNSFFGADADFQDLSTPSRNNNSFFGFFAGGTGGISNATAIGANALVTQSNSLVLGSVSPAVKVGIGTSAPLAKLDVRGDVFVGLTAPADNTTTPGNNIYVADDGGGDARNSYRIDSFNNNFYFVARSGNAPGNASAAGAGIIFRTAPAGGGELDRVSIKSDGTVVTNNDLVVNGNTGQPSDKNGLMKAMLFVSANGRNPGYTIERCYNGVSGSSSGTCGFSISQPGGAGPVYITFPFRVSDRFFSVTLADSLSPNVRPPQVLLPSGDPSGRTLAVSITVSITAFDIADVTDFYLIVY